MKENNRVLFVGNGIAMQMGIAEKWDTIIKDIAKDYDVKLFPDTNNYLPNNMQIVIAQMIMLIRLWQNFVKS